MELAALCQHHMFVAGCELSKVQFQEVAFDGLFVVAQEELSSRDDVNAKGQPQCAQVPVCFACGYYGREIASKYEVEFDFMISNMRNS